MRFEKILIANRGEIACRVIESAKAQGYTTVAVYSEADAGARHVQLADEALCIGSAAVSASYLDADKVLAAAAQSGAQAIHPGYGFLSENAAFARACAAAGLVFIGPGAAAIELMGSKRQSKIAMLAAGVPCVPGYEGAEQGDERLIAEADKIGYPVMVKASAGGGGRGMRIVAQREEMPAALKSARSEALNAFASDELILEKAVLNPRHIEIQVFADEQGQTVYLGERDCSLQRRHQKVVEEAPSPFVSAELRQAMGTAAVEAARACNYRGAGTVEFLVDSERNFYFLEMNTRLQVEHPVTELVTGLDLVALQLRVAQGEPLGFAQDDVQLNGHAIEVRLYAEDPAQGFMPQTGQILRWQMAEGARNDHGIVEGQQVSSHYDPMLAKVICHAPSRSQAINQLRKALADTVLLGVKHNAAFLRELLDSAVFRNGEATTQYIEEQFLPAYSADADSPGVALAALLVYLHAALADSTRRGWWSVSTQPWPVRLQLGEQCYHAGVRPVAAGEYHIQLGEETLVVKQIRDDGLCFSACLNGQQQRVHYALRDNRLWLSNQRGCFVFDNTTHQRDNRDSDGEAERLIRSKINAAVIVLDVAPGQRVSKGQTLAVLEAMKMEHPCKAPADGVVETIRIAVGDQVKPRQVLIELAE
ncbi:MAG: 3-methylcrotonyl-CoA carboxylase [Gammaproteobacteria bacterium]|nr:MAG: 3-methylcrotonyl-CoA carboxylase [Gammaproteobacteria bacterium]